MKTRMERYYNNGLNNSRLTNSNDKRTEQNKELYANTVEINPYNDNNELDIDKIKQIIDEQEQPKKDYKDLLQINKDIIEDLSELERELDKTFDINKIIDKVKDELDASVEKKEDYQQEIVSKIELEETMVDEPLPIIDNQDPEVKLQELFNTITTNSLISQNVPTSELALDVLNELKPTDDSGEVIEGVKEKTLDTAPFKLPGITSEEEPAVIVEPVMPDPVTPELVTENTDITKTLSEKAEEFFTGNIDFQDKDFEDFSDLESAVKSSSKLMWFLIILLILVLSAVGVYVYTSLL